MHAVLIDLDGVLYEGNTLVPNAPRTVAWLQDSGIPHLFLTNTTSRPRQAIQEKLARFGIHTQTDKILTPVIATRNWINENIKAPVALFVPEETMLDFGNIKQSDTRVDAETGAVIIGDLGEGWDFNTYNSAFRLLINNPETVLITLGTTRYWRGEDGLRLDVGAYAKGLEYAASREAIVMGKPSGDFFQQAIDEINVSRENACMIGDDIVGDIKGAQDFGISGILVRTGKYQPSDENSSIRPDAILDTIHDLQAWWLSHLC